MAKNGFSKQNNPTLWAMEMAKSTFDLDEALRLLGKDFPLRRIDEVLGKVIKQRAQELGISEATVIEDLEKKLGKHGGKHDGTQNVRNWLTPGTDMRIERENALRIALVLKTPYKNAGGVLPEYPAEEFLYHCGHNGFYMRDIKDVIYRHSLENGGENGWDYDSTIKMIESFKGLDIDNPDPEDSDSDAIQGKVTIHIENQLSPNLTKEELEEIIQQNKQFFGSFRRTIYKRFTDLYEQVKEAQNDVAKFDAKWDADILGSSYKKATREEICRLIVLGIPEIREGGFSKVIRRCITEGVPGRAHMDEIIRYKAYRVDKDGEKKKRKGKIAEVDRKLFMLVWLATEGSIDERLKTANYEIEDMEFSAVKDYLRTHGEDLFMEHFLVLNDHLVAHGMAKLDARHPFDWIVMNSLRCGYVPDEKNEWITELEHRMRSLVEKMASPKRG